MSTIEKKVPLKREQIHNGKVLFIPSGMAHHTTEKDNPPHFVLSMIMEVNDNFVRWENEYGFRDMLWGNFLDAHQGLYVRLPNLRDKQDRKAVSNWGCDLQGELARWVDDYHRKVRATNQKIRVCETLINRFPL